jgi:hypothetical protein
MSEDHLAAIDALCRGLDAGGERRLAADLRDAVAAASTGTELVMAVRWRLRQALAAGTAAPCAAAMRELGQRLDRLLR